MLERRDFLLAERGADRDREMASGIQHNAAALVARLQATGTSGVRAALGGSPVAYGSLRAAKCILTRRDCDVNSLTRRGTKSRSGQWRRFASHAACPKTLACPKSSFLGTTESLKICLPRSTLGLASKRTVCGQRRLAILMLWMEAES